MKSYIVTCRTPNGDIKERHIVARNHLAAEKAMIVDGFEVISIDRDDDGGLSYRSRKRIKRFIKTIIFCMVIAAIGVAFFWWRYHRG